MDDQKKQLSNNNESKIAPKEYKRVFMCKTAKEVWHTLIITHQSNSQVKDYKIDLLIQHYEKFSISNEETIDSGFTRFNAIVASLKSQDQDYSRKYHIDLLIQHYEKFSISNEETIDSGFTRFNAIVTSLKSQDQDYSRKYHVYEMILENDGVASKTTKEKVRSLAIKAKVTREQTSDDSDSQGGNSGAVINSAMRLIDLEEAMEMALETKEVKAQDKGEIATIAAKKVTSLVNVQSPGRTRLLSEELRAIVKTAMNHKMMQHVSCQSTLKSKAYIVLNKETMRIKESLNINFDERLPEPKSSPSVEDDRINEPIVQYLNRSPSLQVNVSDEGYPKSVKKARGHPIEQVIGELNEKTLRRLSGLDCNNKALPYARFMTTLFEYLKNKHPNDASRMLEVEEVTPMYPTYTMESLNL
ncbi:hypothetical protein Tco_1013817 [Tanacetum coccineum]